jgi:hypothetical protein
VPPVAIQTVGSYNLCRRGTELARIQSGPSRFTYEVLKQVLAIAAENVRFEQYLARASVWWP